MKVNCYKPKKIILVLENLSGIDKCISLDTDNNVNVYFNGCGNSRLTNGEIDEANQVATILSPVLNSFK